MMRILQGTLKNRRLPKHDAWVRPTSAYRREMIFNRLAHAPALQDVNLPTCRVLDVFAGTGALGLEALSRGAIHATFVEANEKTAAQLDDFLKTNDLRAQTTLMKSEAHHLPLCQDLPYQLCFLDAPYHKGLIPKTIDTLYQGGWLAPGALCVAETDVQEPLPLPHFIAPVDKRTKGRTIVWFLRCVTGGAQ